MTCPHCTRHYSKDEAHDQELCERVARLEAMAKSAPAEVVEEITRRQRRAKG